MQHHRANYIGMRQLQSSNNNNDVVVRSNNSMSPWLQEPQHGRSRCLSADMIRSWPKELMMSSWRNSCAGYNQEQLLSAISNAIRPPAKLISASSSILQQLNTVFEAYYSGGLNFSRASIELGRQIIREGGAMDLEEFWAMLIMLQEANSDCMQAADDVHRKKSCAHVRPLLIMSNSSQDHKTTKLIAPSSVQDDDHQLFNPSNKLLATLSRHRPAPSFDTSSAVSNQHNIIETNVTADNNWVVSADHDHQPASCSQQRSSSSSSSFITARSSTARHSHNYYTAHVDHNHSHHHQINSLMSCRNSVKEPRDARRRSLHKEKNDDIAQPSDQISTSASCTVGISSTKSQYKPNVIGKLMGIEDFPPAQKQTAELPRTNIASSSIISLTASSNTSSLPAFSNRNISANNYPKNNKLVIIDQEEEQAAASYYSMSQNNQSIVVITPASVCPDNSQDQSLRPEVCKQHAESVLRSNVETDEMQAKNKRKTTPAPQVLKQMIQKKSTALNLEKRHKRQVAVQNSGSLTLMRGLQCDEGLTTGSKQRIQPDDDGRVLLKLQNASTSKRKLGHVNHGSNYEYQRSDVDDAPTGSWQLSEPKTIELNPKIIKYNKSAAEQLAGVSRKQSAPPASSKLDNVNVAQRSKRSTAAAAAAASDKAVLPKRLMIFTDGKQRQAQLAAAKELASIGGEAAGAGRSMSISCYRPPSQKKMVVSNKLENDKLEEPSHKLSLAAVHGRTSSPPASISESKDDDETAGNCKMQQDAADIVAGGGRRIATANLQQQYITCIERDHDDVTTKQLASANDHWATDQLQELAAADQTSQYCNRSQQCPMKQPDQQQHTETLRCRALKYDDKTAKLETNDIFFHPTTTSSAERKIVNDDLTDYKTLDGGNHHHQLLSTSAAGPKKQQAEQIIFSSTDSTIMAHHAADASNSTKSTDLLMTNKQQLVTDDYDHGSDNEYHNHQLLLLKEMFFSCKDRAPVLAVHAGAPIALPEQVDNFYTRPLEETTKGNYECCSESRLALDAAQEIITRKDQLEDLIFALKIMQITLKDQSLNKLALHRSLNFIIPADDHKRSAVKYVQNDEAKDDHAESNIQVLIYRDIQNYQLQQTNYNINSVWDIEWNHIRCPPTDKYQCAKDIEKEIFDVMLADLAEDLLIYHVWLG